MSVPAVKLTSTSVEAIIVGTLTLLGAVGAVVSTVTVLEEATQLEKFPTSFSARTQP